LDQSAVDSRGIQRVVAALKERPNDLPIRVFHINGRVERMRREIEEWDGDYAIIQYVLRSTQKPSTAEWLPLWRDARLVWSYYDLPALCAEDGVEADFDFYHAPLGISDEFRQAGTLPPKRYTVVTHGDYLTQGTRECFWAVPNGVAHVGKRFNRPEVDFYEDISDYELACLYSSSHYVCGLRRHEGFELPAAEGLSCGARPLLFDRPHYRQWYEEHAEYIIEAPRPDVIEQLHALFQREPLPVTQAEQIWARGRFNWDRIIGGFYERLAVA
jgi:hypothetical protein